MVVLATNAILILLYTFLFRSNKKLIAILGGLQIFFLLALRGDLYGTDALYYLRGFNYISSLSFDQMLTSLNPNIFNPANLIPPFSYENGWVILNWMFSRTGLGYRAFILFLSAFTALSFALFSYRFSKDPGYSIFVLSCMSFLLYSFFILRQTLALCVCLFAVPYLIKRKFLPFFLIVFVAFLFHRSALLFLILYPFSGVRISRKAIIHGLVLFTIIMIASATFLPSLLTAVLSAMGKAHYEIELSWNNLIALQLAITVAICCFFNVDEISKDDSDNICLWGLVSCLLVHATMLSNEILARANEYLWIFVAILIPALLNRFDPRIRTIGRMLVSILLLGYLIYQVQGSDLDPYVSIFN